MDETWNFSAQIERFEGEGHMHFVALPDALAQEVRSTGAKRFVITLNDGVTWHCGLLGTGDGRWFVMVSKDKLKQAQTTLGGWVHVDFAIDRSKYGMPVPPDLQDMLDDDPDFLARFDAMLPGKRRNAMHHIASAKTDATVAKRILKLMNELGLMWIGLCLTCVTLGAQGQAPVTLGNARAEVYLPLLEDQKVAVVGNHTSVVGDQHLVDVLLNQGVDVQHVFAPEHGFRGEAAHGADIEDGVDAKTGLTLYSLHGKHKKPQPEQLNGVDVVVFDIQDVGARFYTYMSTLMLAMEACAAQEVKVIVLDRPNPHGHQMKGPILDLKFQSFVGMLPIPMVHGLTLGEMALMACAEGWIDVPQGWRPEVVPCTGWAHGDDHTLTLAPSPNLPTPVSVDLYPSLCLFEATAVSVGRGTSHPFECVGDPELGFGYHAFTPMPVPGAAPHPKHKGQECTGHLLPGLSASWRENARAWTGTALPGFTLSVLEVWAREWTDQKGSLDGFITSPSFFDKLAGTDQIRIALEQGTPLSEFQTSWDAAIRRFWDDAQPHLLYPWKAPLPGRGL